MHRSQIYHFQLSNQIKSNIINRIEKKHDRLRVNVHYKYVNKGLDIK